MNEVDMVMQEIDQATLDLMQTFLFEWLMIHIQDWKPLELKMEEDPGVHARLRERTFDYVWTIMRKKIANSTEGVNRAAVIASWQKGASAHGRGPKHTAATKVREGQAAHKGAAGSSWMA